MENFPAHLSNVSIDFGATHSGASYVTSTSGQVHQILAWPGSSASVSKIPTCLVYDALCHIRAWGVEAKAMDLRKGWVRCEWFKLWLDPSSAPRTVLASRSFSSPKMLWMWWRIIFRACGCTRRIKFVEKMAPVH
ncbi:hypothetical protein BS47DRAFT_87805 [Hydnum rufescens UP504]|uniref:Uncharacterized protein n=1 Tax=Hydnum rufescens UP504 TaxID=1448309 RepID=A0A9P6DU81_9AGAM|nr:hypothetical protein BS47DRAFT_87805 [Hydnum rufescens UP504]